MTNQTIERLTIGSVSRQKMIEKAICKTEANKLLSEYRTNKKMSLTNN